MDVYQKIQSHSVHATSIALVDAASPTYSNALLPSTTVYILIGRMPFDIPCHSAGELITQEIIHFIRCVGTKRIVQHGLVHEHHMIIVNEAISHLHA